MKNKGKVILSLMAAMVFMAVGTAVVHAAGLFEKASSYSPVELKVIWDTQEIPEDIEKVLVYVEYGVEGQKLGEDSIATRCENDWEHKTGMTDLVAYKLDEDNNPAFYPVDMKVIGVEGIKDNHSFTEFTDDYVVTYKIDKVIEEDIRDTNVSIGHCEYKTDLYRYKIEVTISDKKEEWVNGEHGWWYSYVDGSYAVGWKFIGGEWYYFNENGYMQTGWQNVGGTWYYMQPSGAMTTGWQNLGGEWYYMQPSGAMTTGWQNLGGEWYYMQPNGAMAAGWQNLGGEWYYMQPNGAMAAGWQSLGGKWYYMEPNGAMTTGWQNLGGEWYYMQPGGAMTTGWAEINGYWYYFNGNGHMAANQWVGNCWVNASGAWAA